MASALDGIRVIDFGQFMAGPLAAQLLADQGADVVRVDPPGGPRWDTPANATWNRGKRSIVLDLKTEDGRTTARALAATADVVIENFRPGVMDRFGLGAAEMTQVNPRLVYLSLPGFASDDPRAGITAWEGVVGAASGLYRRNRLATEDGPPVFTAIPLPSAYAAIQGAVAVTMALNARERDGVGQRIEVPLFDAMYGAVGYNGYKLHGDTAAPLGAGFNLTTQWECADGQWIMFHTGNGRTEEVLAAAGVPDWIAKGYVDRERLTREPALVTELMDAARALFKTRPAVEWEQLVNDAGGECAVCRPSAEWVTHPHALGSETVVEVDDPVLGRTRQPGIPARLSRTPGAIRGPRRPLDADRDAILAALERAPSVAGGAPEDAALRSVLEGVRVLDLCIVLAGPTCGRTLAEYGADVIKIEAPGRPPMGSFHMDVNRGKRSIVLDLKTAEGIEVFWSLVDSADVVVQNFRKGVAEKLGVGYEQVRARRPDIVYGSLNTYGHVGPFAGRAGHEQIAQAATGMQDRYRKPNGMPETQKYAVNDYGTGYLGAFAVALALYHRRQTGEGQHVDAALAYTATTLQSSFFIDYAGKSWDEARGQESVGSDPLHRAYRAADGWFFLGAPDAGALSAVEGLDGIGGGAGLEVALESRFATTPVAVWVERLNAAPGAGAHHIVSNTDELMELPYAIEHGLSLTRDDDAWGRVTTIGPAARLSRTPVRPGRVAPPLGAQSREILAEVGLAGRADALIVAGAVWED
ncbi:MAG: CaiB/BaiF CoA transferase family protein [Dehalococcoidia bacterium]